jgi:Dolichyl-phosphate-mannose-protein mannosyltransferase
LLTIKRRGGVKIALAAVLIWAFALRLWLATPDLSSSRFWDERYGIENISGLLQGGELRPANGFHPGLAYLPHAALLAVAEGLHRLTGNAIFAVFSGDEMMTPTGYLLCRLLQVLAGTLSLYLTFRVGERLASPAVGVASALLLAVVPWHLQQSVIFKPDILLVATSLLAMLACLAAAELPAWRRFLWAGGGVGLVLACKFNGGPIAIVPVIAALAEDGWRQRQRWGMVALAGAVAAAVFVLFTPFLLLAPGLYVWSFSHTIRDYSMKGAKLHGSHLQVLLHGARTLFTQDFHGALIGAAGLCGLAAAAAGVRWRRGEAISRAQRVGPRMIVAYVAAYALLYSVSTTNLSEHNWLPVAPYVAVAAAWVLLEIWKWSAGRLAAWLRLALGGTALAAAAVCLVQPANAYVYEYALPSTQVLAQSYLRDHLQPLGWRVVAREEDADCNWYADPAIVDEAKRLDEIQPEILDSADAELFHSERLSGAGSAFYRRRIDRGTAVARFEPRLFRAWGAGVVVVLHPWMAQDDADFVDLSALPRTPGRVAGASPGSGLPGEMGSLQIWLPTGSRAEILQDVLVDGRFIAPTLTGRQHGCPTFLTDRFPLPPTGARVTLVFPRPVPMATGLGVQLQRWRRPARAAAP